MKKTIQKIGLIAVFAFLILLSSKVSAASNGIIIKNEKDLNAVRTDSGNNITIQLKKGKSGQDISELDTNFQKAIDGGIVCYVPVPEEFGTKLTSAKFYMNNDKKTLYNATYVDENFNVLTLGTNPGEQVPEYYKAKYIALRVYVTSVNANTKVSTMSARKDVFDVIYYDNNKKEAKTVEYSVDFKTKLSEKDYDITLTNASNNSKYNIYYGSSQSKGSLNAQKGQELKISAKNIHNNEDLTSKIKIVSENEEVISVSKDGKLIAKKPGVAKIKVQIEDMTTTHDAYVYPVTYFEDTITKAQINDMIEYAKTSPTTDIWYTTAKDTNVSADLLKAAKDLKKDINIYYETKNLSVIWAIKAEDIVDTSKDFDMGVSVVDCYIDALKDRKDITFLDFKHSGKLPGKSNITVYKNNETVENIKAGDVYLYYYNEEAKKVEYVTTAKKDEWGDLIFTIDHCSKYFIAEAKIDDNELKTINSSIANRKLDGEPKTGEEFNIVNVCYMMIVISAIGIVAYKTKE